MTEIRTVADPRVVSETGVVMNQYVGPLNWEHYKIPSSGLSNTQITFANLVTLGTNRIYDSNFEIEYTVDFTLSLGDLGNHELTESQLKEALSMHPFPIHWVTDQLRVNINGAACMTRPQESLPQRMMYWRQRVLDKSCAYCPHTKAPAIMDAVLLEGANNQAYLNHQMKYGKNGSQNVGTILPCLRLNVAIRTVPGIDDNPTLTFADVSITIREPVLCPPFNQRLDKVYQSPLYNITSIDIVYQLNDLRAMFEATYATAVRSGGALQSSALWNLKPSNISSINITDANLCFNVASLPPGMNVPPILNLPYYDNVCYVTNGMVEPGHVGEKMMTSGVYTLAQVPTAIYIFVGPNQLYRSSGQVSGSCFEAGYCPIKSINITMGNNTQLLNTTTEFDRYQMALANGLEDVTWEEFTQSIIPMLGTDESTIRAYTQGQHSSKCILRLIPGIDLLIPDKRLVGGSDAEQMVFQVRLSADVTGIPDEMQSSLSLWIMFEYCGVLTIEPVHASIDMLPIKAIPPIVSVDVVPDTTVEASEGGGEGSNPTGAGIFGNIFKGIGRAFGKAISFLRGAKENPLVQGVGKAILGVADPTGMLAPAIDSVGQYIDDVGMRLERKYPRREPVSVTPPMVQMARDKGLLNGGSIIGGGKLGKFYT